MFAAYTLRRDEIFDAIWGTGETVDEALREGAQALAEHDAGLDPLVVLSAAPIAEDLAEAFLSDDEENDTVAFDVDEAGVLILIPWDEEGEDDEEPAASTTAQTE